MYPILGLLLALVACSKPADPTQLGMGAAPSSPSSAPFDPESARAAPGLGASVVPSGLTVTELPCAAPDGPLGASIIRPASPPSRVAIVAVGAQPWDRWGNIAGGKSYNHYRDLAFGLAKGGLAVVVYDKRGTGESPGPINQIRGRIRDAEAMGACVSAALPGLPHLEIGHSMGSVVVVRARTERVGTVLLSPLLPKGEIPDGPVLALRGERDGPGEGEVIQGADHLLMRDGSLAPEVVTRILAWQAAIKP